MKIAILALQGAFAEHEQMLQHLGAETFLVRNLEDWQSYLSSSKLGLVIPGGESTSMMRIMKEGFSNLSEKPFSAAFLSWEPAQDSSCSTRTTSM